MTKRQKNRKKKSLKVMPFNISSFISDYVSEVETRDESPVA